MVFEEKIKIKLLKDKKKKSFFLVSIYNKYNYKQYILKKNLLYTFFIIINFINKYGLLFLKNVHL
jgi:hypothetical protein